MVLFLGAINRAFTLRFVENRREVQVLGLPMGDGLVCFQEFTVAHHLVDRPKAQLGHDFPDLLGYEHHEIHHALGLARELLA